MSLIEPTKEQLLEIDSVQMSDDILGREVCWPDISCKASDRMNTIAIQTYQRMTCEHEFPEHPTFGPMECELCGQQPPALQ